MYQPAMQYKPRTRLVKGQFITEPARYRRLRISFANFDDAKEAAVSFHSRFVHSQITVPVVITGRVDSVLRFEFV